MCISLALLMSVSQNVDLFGYMQTEFWVVLNLIIRRIILVKIVLIGL
jgi:hypothetical protein